MLLFQDTPWAEDDVAPSRAAIVTVHKARNALEGFAEKLPALRSAIAAACKDLQVIEDAYLQDPESYRRSRSLTAVHLPVLIDGLEQFSKLDQDRIEKDRLALIEAELKTCLHATSEARSRIDQRAVETLQIEIQTLSDMIGPGSSTPVQSDNVLAKGYAQAGRHLTATSARLGKIGTSVRKRATGGWDAARLSVSGVLDDALDIATTPIRTRATAVINAMAGASVSALVTGALVSLVFPPLAPLATGLTLLDAFSIYDDEVTRGDQKTAKAREARKAARQEAMQAALGRLHGKSSVIRMESPLLHITLDLENDKARGLVLAGRYAGQSLNDIDHKDLLRMRDTAPDDETRAILETWTHLSIS